MHYSSGHHNYYNALLYVTKSDCKYQESKGYLDLCNQGELRTDSASRGRRQSGRRVEDIEHDCGDNSQSSPDGEPAITLTARKKRHLSTFEVSEFVVKAKIERQKI